MSESKITIRYFGLLHDIVGKRSETFRINGDSSALDLVGKIASKHGKRFQDFVFDSTGNIRSGIAFAINGSSIDRSLLDKTECRDISEFVILPPISGGKVGEAF